MEDRQFIGGAIGADVERASRVFGELLRLAFQPRARVGRHAAEPGIETAAQIGEIARVALAYESDEARRLRGDCRDARFRQRGRSEEHTSELQALMRISYAVLCLNQKTQSTHDALSIFT